MTAKPTQSHAAWQALHLCVVFVWLWTGLVSLIGYQGISLELLASISHYPIWISHSLIVSGAVLDVVLGVWLWRSPSRRAYAAAGVLMLLMTLLASGLAPHMWLHPLGPLSKNLPLAAALWLLWQRMPTER